jgi:DNA mismatch endonuclease, patch repair protein
MTDVFTKHKRSQIMSRIKGRDNRTTEQALVALLRRNGIRGWRRHLAIEGTPDFAFPQKKVAVFVDGCFWHGCPEHATMPQSNRKFWSNKLRRNKSRDRFVTSALRKQGWKVVRIWEHQLKTNPLHHVERISRLLA